MDLTFLKVGYGEAVIVQKGDYTILLDGGSARDECYCERGSIRLIDYLCAQGISHVDLIIITHLHDDHISGLVPVMETLSVGAIWCNVLPQGDIASMLALIRTECEDVLSRHLFWLALDSYDRIRRIAAARQIPMRSIVGDGLIRTVGGISFQAFGMNPSEQTEVCAALEDMFAESDPAAILRALDEIDLNCNAGSLALLLKDGNGGALLTGDKTGGWESLVTRYDLHAEVLKGTHHGQKDGLPSVLLTAADPTAIVFCTDHARTYDSASPALLARCADFLRQKGRAPLVFVTGDLPLNGACAVTFRIASAGGISEIDPKPFL